MARGKDPRQRVAAAAILAAETLYPITLNARCGAPLQARRPSTEDWRRGTMADTPLESPFSKESKPPKGSANTTRPSCGITTTTTTRAGAPAAVPPRCPSKGAGAKREVVKSLVEPVCSSVVCTWEGPLRDLAAHLREECQHVLHQCPYVFCGCTYAGTRREIQVHCTAELLYHLKLTNQLMEKKDTEHALLQQNLKVVEKRVMSAYLLRSAASALLGRGILGIPYRDGRYPLPSSSQNGSPSSISPTTTTVVSASSMDTPPPHHVPHRSESVSGRTVSRGNGHAEDGGSRGGRGGRGGRGAGGEHRATAHSPSARGGECGRRGRDPPPTSDEPRPLSYWVEEWRRLRRGGSRTLALNSRTPLFANRLHNPLNIITGAFRMSSPPRRSPVSPALSNPVHHLSSRGGREEEEGSGGGRAVTPLSLPTPGSVAPPPPPSSSSTTTPPQGGSAAGGGVEEMGVGGGVVSTFTRESTDVLRPMLEIYMTQHSLLSHYNLPASDFPGLDGVALSHSTDEDPSHRQSTTTTTTSTGVRVTRNTAPHPDFPFGRHEVASDVLPDPLPSSYDQGPFHTTPIWPFFPNHVTGRFVWIIPHYIETPKPLYSPFFTSEPLPGITIDWYLGVKHSLKQGRKEGEVAPPQSLNASSGLPSGSPLPRTPENITPRARRTRRGVGLAEERERAAEMRSERSSVGSRLLAAAAAAAAAAASSSPVARGGGGDGGDGGDGGAPSLSSSSVVGSSMLPRPREHSPGSNSPPQRDASPNGSQTTHPTPLAPFERSRDEVVDVLEPTSRTNEEGSSPAGRASCRSTAEGYFGTVSRCPIPTPLRLVHQRLQRVRDAADGGEEERTAADDAAEDPPLILDHPHRDGRGARYHPRLAVGEEQQATERFLFNVEKGHFVDVGDTEEARCEMEEATTSAAGAADETPARESASRTPLLLPITSTSTSTSPTNATTTITTTTTTTTTAKRMWIKRVVEDQHGETDSTSVAPTTTTTYKVVREETLPATKCTSTSVTTVPGMGEGLRSALSLPDGRVEGSQASMKVEAQCGSLTTQRAPFATAPSSSLGSLTAVPQDGTRVAEDRPEAMEAVEGGAPQLPQGPSSLELPMTSSSFTSSSPQLSSAGHSAREVPEGRRSSGNEGWRSRAGPIHVVNVEHREDDHDEDEDSLVELTPALRALLQIRERRRGGNREDVRESYEDDDDDEEEYEEEDEFYEEYEENDENEEDEEEEVEEDEEEDEEEEEDEDDAKRKETEHGIFLFAHHHSCRTYFVLTIFHPTRPSLDFSFFVTDWSQNYSGKGWGPRELLKEPWLKRMGFIGEKDQTLRLMVELIGNTF